MLDKGPGANTIWECSIPEILLLMNSGLVCLYGFTPVEIMLGFVPKWKITEKSVHEVIPDITNETTQKATQEEVYKIEEGPEGLKIERPIDRKEEQQTFAV